jgi:hypothetical protein
MLFSVGRQLKKGKLNIGSIRGSAADANLARSTWQSETAAV